MLSYTDVYFFFMFTVFSRTVRRRNGVTAAQRGTPDRHHEHEARAGPEIQGGAGPEAGKLRGVHALRPLPRRRHRKQRWPCSQPRPVGGGPSAVVGVIVIVVGPFLRVLFGLPQRVLFDLPKGPVRSLEGSCPSTTITTVSSIIFFLSRQYYRTQQRPVSTTIGSQFNDFSGPR